MKVICEGKLCVPSWTKLSTFVTISFIFCKRKKSVSRNIGNFLLPPIINNTRGELILIIVFIKRFILQKKISPVFFLILFPKRKLFPVYVFVTKVFYFLLIISASCPCATFGLANVWVPCDSKGIGKYSLGATETDHCRARGKCASMR